MNGLHNIQFVEAAVGAPTGTTTFIFSRNTNSHIAGAYVGGSYGEYADKERVDARSEVRCLSLDQLYTEENLPSPNLIKLDIEGAEKDALSHAEKLCSEVKPLIVLELHNPDCDEAAWNFARSTGYTLERMTDGMPIQSREATEGTLLCVPTE
jgi:FkbM family methyltransferase